MKTPWEAEPTRSTVTFFDKNIYENGRVEIMYEMSLLPRKCYNLSKI